jgi:hypothetical protein
MLTPIALLSLATAVSIVAESEGTPAPRWIVGAPALVSIGELTFSPDGVLFVADPLGSAIFAVKTTSDKAGEPAPFLIEGPDTRIAGLLGTSATNITINDIVVHPQSGDLYLSVTRGAGESALPALVRVNAVGDFEEVRLDDVEYMRKEIKGAADDRRALSITDLAFVDGRLFVAGLSNEEFSSNLRSLAFPFDASQEKTAIEIYHGNHGTYETHAPVRTFMPYEVEGETVLVAAYTCTPLVTFAVGELEPGSKVRGKTVAELGGGNRPLDMVGYEKDGERFILISNDRHGVMKVPTKDMGSIKPIVEAVSGTAGMEFETIEELRGVLHMTPAGDGLVAVLIKEPESTSLMLGTIELP